MRCPRPAAEIAAHLLTHHDIIAGYDLSQDYEGMENYLLIAVTEMNSHEEIDYLVETLSEEPHA